LNKPGWVTIWITSSADAKPYLRSPK
jgi:hypothetical protein